MKLLPINLSLVDRFIDCRNDDFVISSSRAFDRVDVEGVPMKSVIISLSSSSVTYGMISTGCFSP
jgi:hypothetical protein